MLFICQPWRRAYLPVLTLPSYLVMKTRGGAQGAPAMSAGLDFASIRRSSAVEVISAVPPQSFNPTAMSRLEGRPVICSPEQLRLHRALEELGWTGVIDEFNDAARLKEQSVPEPILITTNRTILAGFGRWRSAVFDGRHPESDVRSAVVRHARTTAGLVPAAISGRRSTREESARRASSSAVCYAGG